MIKYGKFTLGEVEAVFNKIGGEKAVKRLLADELVICEKGSKKAKELKPMSQNSLVLSTLITAGHYDWWNKDILSWRREDPPPTELGETELVHLGRSISTDNAIAELDKQGYRPANAEELADYGAKNPEEQRKYPIGALGSVFVCPQDGDRYSPCLDVYDAERELRLSRRDGDWNGRCWFLVVRK